MSANDTTDDDEQTDYDHGDRVELPNGARGVVDSPPAGHATAPGQVFVHADDVPSLSGVYRVTDIETPRLYTRADAVLSPLKGDHWLAHRDIGNGDQYCHKMETADGGEAELSRWLDEEDMTEYLRGVEIGTRYVEEPPQ